MSVRRHDPPPNSALAVALGQAIRDNDDLLLIFESLSECDDPEPIAASLIWGACRDSYRTLKARAAL